MLSLFVRMSEKKNALTHNRNYFVLLYTDNPEHVKALENIKRLCENYAYILHDKDCYKDTDDIKKEHIHVVVKFPNKRYRSAVAKDFGLEERFLEGCKLESGLRYLLHLDDEDKYRYDVSEVKGTLLPYLHKILNSMGKDEGERASDLFKLIDSTTTAIKISDFSKYCAVNGYWDLYRRSSTIFRDYIREHNQEFYIQSVKQGWEHISNDEIFDLLVKYK